VRVKLRRAMPATAVVVVVLAAAALALALTAPPASAFEEWEHDVAVCEVCHAQGSPADATCTSCHMGFQSYPGMTCWSCHAPGQDTSTLSSPSAACSQECHLWNAVEKQYLKSSTHGADPHLGATAACLGCHPASVNASDPGDSPHHSGQATGISKCGVCHSSPQKHAGKVACSTCHATAEAFHTFTATSPGYKKCGSCHTVRHAGKKVATGKCATCHKGSSGRSAQHSTSLTKKRTCGSCHKQKLHARSVSKAVKNCNTCHAKKFHAKQPTPGRATCTKCHSRAKGHASGYQCTLCHRRAVHATRPSATN
jgi:hypothetical protein